MFGSMRGYIQAALHTKRIDREFDRIGITFELLQARAAEIDAATPDFAQARGKSWEDVGKASAAYLALLRRVRDGGGPDAVIAEFTAAGKMRR
jgi:hypothetical protein